MKLNVIKISQSFLGKITNQERLRVSMIRGREQQLELVLNNEFR
jgi:hypothetical protein